MSELYKTKDGSHSLKSSRFGESYHSINGAIQESQIVFIDAGLKYICQQNSALNILEIGFGTGLNALMTFLETTVNENLLVDYTGIEAYPIDTETAAKLNYCEKLGISEQQQIFMQMHRIQAERIALNRQFTFTKKIELFEDVLLDTACYDLIYFDAFAPAAQPHLWQEALLQKMYDCLKKGGVLTTYCAKGVVKRCLKSVGFKIEALPGPIGKREITRAIK